MLDVEKFLIALRSNRDLNGLLKPIHLVDTVQEEIKIIQAAVEYSRREWVGLTDEQISDLWCKVSNTDFVTADTHEFARAVEQTLKEKNT